MNVLRNPGHDSCKCCIVSNWTSPLIQEFSLVLTNWRGVAGFSTLCGSVLSVHLWAVDPTSMWAAKAR